MKACIDALLKKGEIDQNVADILFEAEKKSKTMDDMMGHVDSGINEAKMRYHSKAINHKKTIDLIDLVSKAENKAEAISDLIAKRKGMAAIYANIEYTIKEYSGRALKPLANHLDALRSKFGGFKLNTKLLDTVALKIFDNSAQVTKEASDIVKAMEESLQLVNERAASNGLVPTITELTDLGALSSKIQNLSPEDFTTFVRPLVQNTDNEILAAHKAALDGEEFVKFKFNGPEAEKTYRDRIGGDAFSNLINYIDRMSARSAASNILGHNPIRTIETLGKEADLSKNEIGKLVNIYEHATGTNFQKQKPGVPAKGVSALRAIGTASMMGGATITALLDIATMGMTARFNGLPQMEIYRKMIKNLVSKGSRMELAQVGFQLESVLSTLSNTSRFNPHSTTSNVLNNAATGVLRVSGLLAMSDAAKLSVKNSFLTKFRNTKNMSLDQLMKKDNRFYKQLRRYGIHDNEWNAIRKQINDKDIVVDPSILDDASGHLVYRLINEEADYAVVTPGARSAHWTSAGQDKGTLTGEVVKSMTQFKSTIVEQVLTHLYRTARQSGFSNQLSYGAWYFVSTTILGGMVYELKEMTNNRTPVNPMKNPLEFLSESMKQGGAVPILSDIIAPHIMDPKFYDKGIIESLLSPASLNTPYRMIENAVKAVASDSKKDISKAEASLATDAASLLTGQNIWYTKAIFNEYVKEALRQLIDPKGAKKRNRRINKEMKKHGQKNLFDL